MPLHELMMITLAVVGSESGRLGSVTATARLCIEVIRVGMWKDLYCFALRIDMVLPDWRGFIGLGLVALPSVSSCPIDLKLALQPHILKATCTKPCASSASYLLIEVVVDC